MSTTPEQTINDIRKLIVANRKAGLAPDHGIDRDTIKDAIRTLRSSRVLDTSKTTKGKSTKKAKAPKKVISDEALNKLLGL